MSKLIARLALMISSVLLALTASEAALRFLDLYPPPPRLVQSRRPDLYTSDSDVGYRLHSFLDTTYVYPPDRPDPIPLRANSDGFRNAREFERQDDRRTVLVVGDSFVFGEGVRAEERLTEVIESLDPEWRVENLGMPGWGLDLMIRAIERFAPTMQPDVVVLSIYTDDFRRLMPYYAGAGFVYAKFDLRRGEVVSLPPQEPGAFERMRLMQTWHSLYWARRQNRFDLNEALLNRFLQDARDLGFEPMTVFIPGRDDNAEDKQRRGFLADWADARGVTHLDLTGPIHTAGVDNVYIPGNWHWNPEGHRIAAEEIHAALAFRLIGNQR